MLIILFVINIGLAGLLAWLWVRIRFFEKAYGSFFRTGQPQPVMQTLNQFGDQVIHHNEQLKAIEGQLQQLKILAEHGYSRVGFVRFNPFADTGGDQSFCLALLDTHGSGWVLSSIHARTGTRVYSKQVLDGRSIHNLSEEESTAVTKALKQNPYHAHAKE